MYHIFLLFLLFLLFTDVLAFRKQSKPTYYLVQRDYRRCPSPRCSGYFLKALNKRTTRCADRKRAEWCYVAAFRFGEDSALNEKEQIQFIEEVGDGDIVLGTFNPNAYEDLGFENIADLIVISGWIGFEEKLK